MTDNEPDFYAPIPCRTELTVLGADDPNREPIGLRMYERDGTMVFKLTPDGPVGPLMSLEDIQAGDEVRVTTCVGVLDMVVRMGSDGKLGAYGGAFANLEFDKDDRHCWVSTYAVVGHANREPLFLYCQVPRPGVHDVKLGARLLGWVPRVLPTAPFGVWGSSGRLLGMCGFEVPSGSCVFTNDRPPRFTEDSP